MDDENNVVDEQTNEEVVEETTEETQEEVQTQDTPDESEAPEQTEETNETETPEPKPAQETETPDEDEYPVFNNQYVPESVPIESLPLDSEGYIDANAYQQWIRNEQLRSQAIARQTARQEFADLQREQKGWSKIEAQYPEVKENPQLRQLIHNQRSADIMNGGTGELTQAAKTLFDQLTNARTEATVKAQNSIKTQKSAHLDSSNTRADTGANRKQELFNQISSHNREDARQARIELLKEMMDD